MNTKTDKYNSQVEECLYCDGLKYHCKYYIKMPQYEKGTCMYFDVIQHDLDKLKEGNKCLTFPQLEDLIKDNKLTK